MTEELTTQDKRFKISPLIAGTGVRHGFFTRCGGVSEGLFDSLNCGYGSGDDIAKVAQNRSLVTAILGASTTELCTVFQEHGTTVAVVEAMWNWGEAPQADAIITKVPGLAIGVLTADCVPVLLADNVSGMVAAVHAGWKGAIGGIVEETIKEMCTQGAARVNICAAIGPCIGQDSYEVGEEFFDTFRNTDEAFIRHFSESEEGRKHFDIKGFVRKKLETMGVNRIDVLEEDTCALEEEFFSFRRSTKRREPSYGRQVSAIMLTPVV